MGRSGWLVWAKRISWLVCGVLWCIGLAGVPGDVRQWSVWLKGLGEVMDEEAWRWVSVVAGLVILVAFNVPWRRAVVRWRGNQESGSRPKTKGHGLPVKRQKERHWRQRIEEFIEATSDIGRSPTKATAWRMEVVDMLDTLLVDPTERRRLFLARTESIADGKEIIASVDKGVRYLRDIGSVDGGELQ